MKGKSTDERYLRQVALRGFGEAAQNALLQAKVLVVGAGGLGCPVLQYLTAAGTGCIGLVDSDIVSMSNLHRQVLYSNNDIGLSKVSVAAAKLRLMNPDSRIVEYPIRLNKNNCLDIINLYDVVVDCTDNFATRYMINDACVLKKRPLVHGAVNRFEGQVAVFNVNTSQLERTANYRDLFPEQPLPGEFLNCAEAGVLGVLPGIIGSIQASEVIKLITGVGDILVNQLLTFNTINNQLAVFEYGLSLQSSATMPRTEEEFLEMNYEQACVTNGHHFAIDAETFDTMLTQTGVQVIDVREPSELPELTEFKSIRISLGDLKNKMIELENDNIVFLCQSGTRSLQAASLAADYFGETDRFFSLNGGILSWKNLHEKNSA